MNEPILPPGARRLALDSWPRRSTFEYFRHYRKPWFSLCTRLDVAGLQAALRAGGGEGINLGIHFLALREANRIEPFRYRIDGSGVCVLARVDGSLTVLRADESLAFARVRFEDDFPAFARAARRAIDAARRASPGELLDPLDDDRALLHFTTLPWVHFTSFEHARDLVAEDSVPKIAFGRLQPEGPHLWLPMAVEVHHALMDGLHVGRFVQGLEAALAEPAAWLPTTT